MEPTTATTYKDVAPALNGKFTSTPIVHDPEYGDYLSAFAPIMKDGKVIGILGVDINAENVTRIGDQILLTELPLNLALNGLIIVIVILLLTWLIGRRLKPLNTINLAARQMAEGELLLAKETVDSIKITGNDEIKQVLDSFKHMTSNTIQMVTEIKGSSHSLLLSTEEIEERMAEMNQSNQYIVGGIQEVAGATDTQLERSEESVKAIEEMAIGIQRIAEASTDVSEQANHVSQQVKEGFDDIQTIITQIISLQESVNETASFIENLGEQATEIRTIVNLISGISEQTNLLALNAAIEAARAGEHGKGFAVVSQEVRKLAEESKISAEKISVHLNGFKTTIEQAVNNMHDGTQKVEESAQVITKTGEKFHQILKAAEKVSGEIQEVSAITEEMSASSEEVSASIEEFSVLSKETANVSQKVASSTDELTEAMENINVLTSTLKEMSSNLEQSVEKFKL